jgi:hypothetical protein
MYRSGLEPQMGASCTNDAHREAGSAPVRRPRDCALFERQEREVTREGSSYIVLAIGVAISLLRSPNLIAHQQHRRCY